MRTNEHPFGSLPPSLRAAQIRASYEAAHLFIAAGRKALADAKAEPWDAGKHHLIACSCFCIALEARDSAREERRSLKADLAALYREVLPTLQKAVDRVKTA